MWVINNEKAKLKIDFLRFDWPELKFRNSGSFVIFVIAGWVDECSKRRRKKNNENKERRRI
jgi:hypothetical protein